MVAAAQSEAAVLDRQYHARLLADIDGVCRVAGVKKELISHPAKWYCSKGEVAWLRDFRARVASGSAGLMLVGPNHNGKNAAGDLGTVNVTPALKMMAMAAALLRNYIDARVLSVTTLIEDDEVGDVPDPTVLLVPDFYVDFEGGKQLPAYKAQRLYSILMDRYVASRATILYVQSVGGLEKNYGGAMKDFLDAHWIKSLGKD